MPEPRGELVNRVVVLIISCFTLVFYFVQLISTIQRERLHRLIEDAKRRGLRVDQSRLKKFSRVSFHPRMFHVIGACLSILLVVRSVDPVARNYYDPVWLRLVTFNSTGFMMMLFCVALDSVLRTALAVRNQYLPPVVSYVFGGAAVLNFVGANVWFIVFTTQPTGQRILGYVLYLLFLAAIQTIMVIVWDIAVWRLHLTVSTVVARFAEHFEPSSVVGYHNDEEGPHQPTLTVHVEDDAGETVVVPSATPSGSQNNLLTSPTSPSNNATKPKKKRGVSADLPASSPPIMRLPSERDDNSEIKRAVRTLLFFSFGLHVVYILGCAYEVYLSATILKNSLDDSVDELKFPSDMFFMYLHMVVAIIALGHSWQSNPFRFLRSSVHSLFGAAVIRSNPNSRERGRGGSVTPNVSGDKMGSWNNMRTSQPAASVPSDRNHLSVQVQLASNPSSADSSQQHSEE